MNHQSTRSGRQCKPLTATVCFDPQCRGAPGEEAYSVASMFFENKAEKEEVKPKKLARLAGKTPKKARSVLPEVRGQLCSGSSPPGLPQRCPLWRSTRSARLGPMHTRDVGSQGAPVVRGAWQPEIGPRGLG